TRRRRLVVAIAAVAPREKAAQPGERVQRPGVGAREARATGTRVEAPLQPPRLDERLADAVEQKVGAGQAAAPERALLLDAQPGRLDRVAQARRRIEPAVTRPDAGERAAADVCAERREQAVERVPGERKARVR